MKKKIDLKKLLIDTINSFLKEHGNNNHYGYMNAELFWIDNYIEETSMHVDEIYSEGGDDIYFKEHHTVMHFDDIESSNYYDLYNSIYSLADDADNKKINIGDKVIWCDPETEYRDLSRIYTVFKINGDIISVSDDFSEVEVTASEIEKLQDKR